MGEENRTPSVSRIQGTLIIAILALMALLPFLPTSAGSPQWEYTVEAIPDFEFTEKMNALGAEGWEAVSARRASDGNEYRPSFSYEIIFKRPVLRRSRW